MSDRATRRPVAGIDIGGSKIAVLIIGPDGAVLGRATRSSSVADQDGAAAAIAGCLDEALAADSIGVDDLDAIGVGVPGRVDPVLGHVTLAVNLGWTDFDLRGALEARLRRPVAIENDARAAAVGLHRRGILGPLDDLAYLAVGTGIAAGVILDGALHRGARGLAGEIGHAIVEADGPACACGQFGCLESFASGPSIARRAVEAVAAGRRSSLPLDGAPITSVDVYAAARTDDPLACELVEDVGRRLAWAIHVLVMTYDVTRVVVGGGVSHAGATFADPLHAGLERLRSASPQAGELLPADIVEILPADAEAGAWGAAAIARSAADHRNGSTSSAGSTAGGTWGEEVVRHA